MELTYTFMIPVHVTIDTDMPEGERITAVNAMDDADHSKGYIQEAVTTPLAPEVFELVKNALDTEVWPAWDWGW